MGKKPKPITTPLSVIYSILNYDPDEIVFIEDLGIEMKGTFRWKIPMDNGKKKIGSLAGCLTFNKKYWRIYIFGQEVLSHRLAWYMHHGKDPGVDFLVDHKEGDTFNNSPEFLRLATDAENSQNRKKGSNNTTGFKGVYLTGQKEKPFGAHIWFNDQYKKFGPFKRIEQAALAYKKASIKYHGEFGRE
tara:strand:+ start:82 stop:645 length:564 start_codon:yes stop_codon:yes gene_type:complete